MSEIEATNDVAALTVQLLSAYLANNTVASDDLAGLIRSTKDALTGTPSISAELEPETFTPAVSLRKSLSSPEHIISLIDGRPYKTLKRHLQSHGLTPDDYRSRYNLPASYPMVAPEYSNRRRAVAQEFGLGGKRAAAVAESASSGADASSGTADPQAAPEPTAAHETKQAPASAAKTKRRKRPANTASTKSTDPAVTQSPASSADADASSDAATSSINESTQTDAPPASGNDAKPAIKKRPRTSARTKAAEGTRGKSKTKERSESATESGREAALVPQESTTGEQAAGEVPKAKRRPNSKVLKKTDDAPTDATEPLTDVPAATAPAKQTRRPRMAREPEASQDDQATGSVATENKPEE